MMLYLALLPLMVREAMTPEDRERMVEEWVTVEDNPLM